jgi:hypothetical protein
MGKVVLFTFYCILICCTVNGQQSMNGVLSGSGAIYLGDQINTKNSNYYYGGSLTYFLDNHFSFGGELLYLKGESLSQKTSYFNSIHLLTGFNYVYGESESKLVCGIYSGLSYLKGVSYGLKSISYKNDIVPNVGLGIGYKLYFHPYFHFFTDVKYLYEQTLFNEVGRGEVLFSFGLGGQIQTKRKK